MNKELICDNCGKQDETVEETVNPYMLEIHGETEEATLCDECYQLCCDEI